MREYHSDVKEEGVEAFIKFLDENLGIDYDFEIDEGYYTFFYGLDNKEAKEVSTFLTKNDFYFKHEENEDV